MRLRTALVWLVTLLYPVIIYLGLGRFEPRWMALFLLAMVLARAIISRDVVWLGAAVGALLLVIVSILGNQSLPLKLYPVLVSGVMLAVFGLSLRHPPSAIERIARLHDPQLPPEAVAYTRKVTEVWCLFFIANGCVSLATAMWGSDRVWAIYNGLISYVLMGILFVGEWLMRKRMRARNQHG
ncbi:MAG TPA: hypothetical protein VK660_03145 [Xanthomonadaceae bacterium]|jgi:uncharacterized membrane protein|nr:hypothetical protein [Xanthomonadaceae bacterium]